SEMSLDVKIGQMIMVGFRGLDVNEKSPVMRDIVERHIGGVILYDYDVPTNNPARNRPGRRRSVQVEGGFRFCTDCVGP
ncbi:MAG: hypothetical protein ACYSX1_07085, partial [Planctomycetota bacterium]